MKRVKIIILCIFVFAVFLCGGISNKTAFATTDIEAQVFQNTSYYDRVLISGDPLKFNDVHATSSYDTGILFYSSLSEGQTYRTAEIKLNNTHFYIDFTNAKDIFYTESVNHFYEFTIKDFEGNIVWYAKQSIIAETGELDNIICSLIQDINGSITVFPNRGDIDARLIGEQIVDLASDKYLLKNVYQIINEYSNDLTVRSTTQTTGSLTVDTESPQINVAGIESGTVSDTNSFVNELLFVSIIDLSSTKLYYKDPLMEDFVCYTDTSITSTEVEGWHYFYAEDEFAHRSDIFSFYYDINPPNGRITTDDGDVESNDYINKDFAYFATDDGSGVDEFFYKTPNMIDFQPYIEGTIVGENSEDGWYSFYSIDRSGNTSSVVSVFLETDKPTVSIYQNQQLAYSETVDWASNYNTDLHYKIGDKLRVSCVTSSGKVTSNLQLDTDIVVTKSLFPNSAFEIVITDVFGSTSNFQIYIEQEKPIEETPLPVPIIKEAELIIEGIKYKNSTSLCFNSDTTISWTSSTSKVRIVSNDEEVINSSNISEFILSTAECTNNSFQIYLTNSANKISTFYITIDRENPCFKIISDEKEIENESYTNKPAALQFWESDVTALYSLGDDLFLPYESDTVFAEDGTYSFLLTDGVGNQSFATFTIKTTAPTGQLYADQNPTANNSITNGQIVFSWEGEITATVNGVQYVKDTILTADGRYTFVLTDFAGNFSTYVITLDTTAPTIGFTGVENNGKTNGVVTITDPSKDGSVVEVYYYDEILEYKLGDELSEYGQYRVVVTDAIGNKSEYFFSIEYAPNGGAVALIVIIVVGLIAVAVMVLIWNKTIYKKVEIKGVKTNI